MSATVIGEYTVGPTASSLLTGLIAFWKLGEASGTRNDSAGSNHLSDNNTVTQAAGKIGNAAQFTKTNSEWLSIADNANLSLGAGVHFTFGFWVYHDAIAAEMYGYISKDDGGSNREFGMMLDSGVFKMDLWDPSNNYTEYNAGSVGFSSVTWYFLCLWYDGSNINLSINNAAPISQGYTADFKDGIAPFEIGRTTGLTSRCMDGRIDAVGFWKRALTSDERTALYNGGAGIEYPFS